MGRKLKRVPLDFDAPLRQVWQGYVNPHYIKCPDCEGNGSTPAREYLNSIVHLILMAGGYSLKVTSHPWLDQLYVNTSKPPSKDMAELSAGLAGRMPDSAFGHDAMDRWKAVKKVIEAAGLNPDTWGICPTCEGEGIHPDYSEKYNAWKETEPPKGEGYQLWETTSEGSPVSPVFATLDELCTWAEENATTFASFRATKEQWKQMLSDGFVCHQEGNAIFI